MLHAHSRRVPGKPLLATASLLLVLSACTTVGLDFEPPEVPWLENWSSTSLSEANKSAPPAQAPTDQWWDYFNDPVLDALVAEAQRQNPDVRTAGLRDFWGQSKNPSQHNRTHWRRRFLL